MTPQLMQAIKLLQLSNLDLAAYVEGELERNPLLERDTEGEGPAEPEAPQHEGNADGDAQAGDWLGEDLQTSRTDMESQLGTGSTTSFRRIPANPRRGREPKRRSRNPNGPARVRAAPNTAITIWKLSFPRKPRSPTISPSSSRWRSPIRPRRMIGQYLIDMVDEAGYLTGDLEAVAQKLGAPMAEVEAVLAIVQGFDPVGVCARNLNECLAMQLKERDRYDPAMRALVENLPMLANRQLTALKKICGVGDEDLADMIGEIRRLNPKPGLAFGSTMVQPSFRMCSCGRPDGGWLVELNPRPCRRC
jgi:RNA polymerase sigma-54 factor